MKRSITQSDKKCFKSANQPATVSRFTQQSNYMIDYCGRLRRKKWMEKFSIGPDTKASPAPRREGGKQSEARNTNHLPAINHLIGFKSEASGRIPMESGSEKIDAGHFSV